MKRKFFVVLFFCFLFCVFVAVSFLLALELRDRSFSSINNSTEYKERQGPPLNWKSHFISVYFTSPGIKGGEVEIIKELVVFLNSARESIYGAIYDLDYEPIAELLIHKFQQGVDVKIVVERDNCQRESILKCKTAGIPVVEDDNSALMHDKFFIVDVSSVWTGSTNMTYNCLFLNNNNSILIQSPQLAENYFNEFQEMFFSHHYGMKSPRNTKYVVLHIDNMTTLWNMFAPEDGVERKIIEEIQNTQKSLQFMAFSFTSAAIASRLIQAKDRGVIVKGVFEKRNAGNSASKDEYLRHAGMDIRWDSNPKTMHHKVMIFDEHRVLTGSYNFTESAEKRNDENVIIIDNPEIARLYIDEFYRVFEIGIPVR